MTEELKDLVKQSLSIVSTSTVKDTEINMWIDAGIEDLKRQGIKVGNTPNSLVKPAIVMYVKANFGNVSIEDKELSLRTYNLLCTNLGLSSDYKEVTANG